MKISKILAKSDGTTLIEHSNKVVEEILKLHERFIKESEFDFGYALKENLINVGKLHDIGKITSQFQNKMKKYGDDVDVLVTEAGNPIIKHRHAEVSYAFLSTYTTLPEEVLKIIYFHHSLSAKNYVIEKIKILKDLKDEDIENMKEYVRYYDETLLRDTPNYEGFTPTYLTTGGYHKDAEFLAVLPLFIVADRIASGALLNVDQLIKKVTENLQIKNPYGDSERTKLQNELSKIKDKMFCLNATTGFGKTAVAMKWGLESDLKTFLVSPRNIINKAVYENLNKELEVHECNATNSLIQGNQIQESFNIELDSKNVSVKTDFVTLNIDSFLNGTFSYDSIDLLFCLIHCDVVFDEYHELLNGGNITALFRRVLIARKWFGSGKTLLMSATPIAIDSFIDPSSPIQKYPKDKNFYDPIHDLPYKVEFVDIDGENFTMGDKPFELEDDTITFLNSKEDAKRFAQHLDDNRVIHYEFLESDKEIKRQRIKVIYGKNSDSNTHREGWLGTLILRTSLDVSFKNMVDVVCSPMSTIQSTGRCNRFGTINDSKITFARIKSKSDFKTIGIQYQNTLSALWYGFLKEKVGETVTLKELYDIYSLFMDLYRDKMYLYLVDKFNEGEKQIERIFPKRKFASLKTKQDKIIGGSNILRKKGGTLEIFIIAKDINGVLMEEPLNYTIYLNTIESKPIHYILGYKNEHSFIKAQVNFQYDSEFDPRFDYKLKAKSQTIPFNTLIDAAIDSQKPIYLENAVYDPGKGIFIKRYK